MNPDCPKCVELGLTSTVTMHTAMGGRPVRPIMDDEGHAHLHETDPVTVHWGCSNRHSWIDSAPTPCPVRGCTWKPGDDPMSFTVVETP